VLTANAAVTRQARSRFTEHLLMKAALADQKLDAGDVFGRIMLAPSITGPADGEQPMVRQQRTVIDAAQDAGVSQIVKVSVWGARQGGPLAANAGPIASNPWRWLSPVPPGG
jgi:uncharacterized protein YbjT (DUF2867 family)